jgi:hypothetical protein
VFVAGQVATVLRFEKVCDPARTVLAPGWDRYFEPLIVSGGTVVLIPLRDIQPQDRVPLMVSFFDGTALPFAVTSRSEQTDQQVNLLQTGETRQALRWRLTDALREKRVLGVENERYRKEALSADHALAGLLATGAEELTPLIEVSSQWIEKGSTKTKARFFGGKGKAAVVFQVTNKAQTNWGMSEAHLQKSPSGENVPFALRMSSAEILPGATGTIAVVVDRSAFLNGKRTAPLTFQLSGRDGHRISVELTEDLARSARVRGKQ